MSNGKVFITDDEFLQLPQERRDLIQFRAINKMQEESIKHRKKCDERFCKIEKDIKNRKVKDKAYAAGGGVVGGFIAHGILILRSLMSR